MIIKKIQKDDCCGCTACASICSHGAITMEPDALGFLYPKIDENKCVDCGLCESICQFHEGYNRYDNYRQPLVYGCRHKNEAELIKSQSGAISFAIIDRFIGENSAVYGVVFTHGFHVIHKRATSKEECSEFRGSKYVQSDLRGVFSRIKIDLKAGMRVLFIGTSCQVAGLRSFISDNLRKNLYTIDIVCHAVPSPKVWEDYIKFLERKYKESIVSANFRNKKFGWESHTETFMLECGKEILKKTFRDFFFYNHLAIRKSCTKCHFTNLERIGDISLADFWGWKKCHSEWNDNMGVSLVLVNSDKGRGLFNSVNDDTYSILSSVDECLQPQLISPATCNPRQDEFYKDFETKGFEYCAKKYADYGLRYKIKRVWVSIKYHSGYMLLKEMYTKAK